MQKHKAYSVLAKFYDKLLDEHCDYEKWSQYLYSILVKTSAKKGIDLACGTGKMTALLRKGGFDVIGMDSSVDMLNIARSQSNGIYVCCDMQQLEVGKKVDFVTCINDGINYISAKNLTNVFGRIFNALRSGGVLIFDVSSQYKLVNILGNNVYYYDNEDCTCLWTNKLNSDNVRLDLTLFEPTDNGLYTRQDESHTQYIHDEKFIVDTLKSVGFENIIVNDNYTQSTPNMQSQRLTFVAYKQQV